MCQNSKAPPTRYSHLAHISASPDLIGIGHEGCTQPSCPQRFAAKFLVRLPHVSSSDLRGWLLERARELRSVSQLFDALLCRHEIG